MIHKVVEWFKHIYPEHDFEEDRLRQVIYRTAERSQRALDLPAYLSRTFEVDWVTADLQEWGLTRSVLLNPEHFQFQAHQEKNLTNKAVLDIFNFQNTEKLPYTFAAQWISRILQLEASDKVVKILNKKFVKLKDRRRKIQCDKKAPPEAMVVFYNELFEHDLVLSNFSINCETALKPTTSTNRDNDSPPQRILPDSALVKKLKEDLKANVEKVKLLDKIVKEEIPILSFKSKSSLKILRNSAVVIKLKILKKKMQKHVSP